ncbi:MAG: autotransporter outer membrane beta-barrel domain-containing protein [Puniceicoccales bacterium]|nr:autotransporter outer membrane beta-barrel domain-containing protein [Puniceicoccales bacterium]
MSSLTKTLRRLRFLPPAAALLLLTSATAYGGDLNVRRGNSAGSVTVDVSKSESARLDLEFKSVNVNKDNRPHCYGVRLKGAADKPFCLTVENGDDDPGSIILTNLNTDGGGATVFDFGFKNGAKDRPLAVEFSDSDGGYAFAATALGGNSRSGAAAIFGTAHDHSSQFGLPLSHSNSFNHLTVGGLNKSAISATASGSAPFITSYAVAYGIAASWAPMADAFNFFTAGNSRLLDVSVSSLSMFGAAAAYGLGVSSSSITGSFNDFRVGSSIFCRQSVSAAEGAVIFGYGLPWQTFGYFPVTESSFNRWRTGDFCGTLATAIACGGSATAFGYGGNLLWGTTSYTEGTGPTVRLSFNGWTIGNFIDSTVSAQAFNGYASTFGAASVFGVKDSFNNWTCGAFERSLAMAISQGATTAAACVFGPTYAKGFSGEKAFSNWSLEFRGSNVIGAIAYSPYGPEFVSANAIGGWTNGDMRVYFSGKGGDYAEVTLMAAKLQSAIVVQSVSGLNEEFAVVQLSGHQGNGLGSGWGRRGAVVENAKFGRAMAIAMGDGFQLNVGRTREMVDGWQEMSANGEGASGYGGGWELDASAANGGSRSDGAGVLNVIGAISRTQELQMAGDAPIGTVLRIDGGWTMNCFGPVKDLGNIDLINGQLVLVNEAPNGEGHQLLSRAVDQLSHGIIYRDDGANEYVGSLGDRCYFSGRNGFVMVDYSRYPIGGTLSLRGDDAITFHATKRNALDGAKICTNKLFVTPADGNIMLLGGADKSILRLEQGCKIAVETDAVEVPSHVLVVLAAASAENDGAITVHVTDPKNPLAIAPDSVAPVSAISADSCTYYVAEGLRRGSGVELKRIEDYIFNLQLPDDSALYWFREIPDLIAFGDLLDDADYLPMSGLAVGRNVPGYLRVFYGGARGFERSIMASGTLALEAQRSVNMVRRAAGSDYGGLFGGAITASVKNNADTLNPFGCKSNVYGVAVGGTKLIPTKLHSVFASLYVGFTSGKTTYDGGAVERLLKTNRSDGIVGAAAKFIGHIVPDLTGTAQLSITASHGRIRSDRENEDSESFSGKFNDSVLQLDIAASQGVVRSGNVEFGLFGEMAYDSVSQNGLHEKRNDGKTTGGLTLESIRHNLVSIELGVSAGTYRQGPLNLRAKLGWQHAVVRNHNKSTATVGSTPYEAEIFYGGKNFAILDVSARHMISEKWDCGLNLDGSFASNRTAFSAGLNFCKLF